ncbi:MAG TPA: SgcJ/EcaC family oxidoreductase [Candidatus Polarisedimenticolia bacterium]|nr:SgcJ/EcaC family oxidoreductase [Candidatus Polarisedimenticolia bacterium]
MILSKGVTSMARSWIPRLPVVAGILLLASPSCTRPAGAPAFDQVQAETEIQGLERAWAEVAVSGNPSVIERIFADDFLGVSPDGKQYTKQQFIDDTKAHPLGFTSNEVNDIKVRFEGNVAIAQGRETFTRKDGVKGRFVWTDILVNRKGQWQILAAQDVMVPATDPPAAAALFGDKSPAATTGESPAGGTPATAADVKAGIDKARNGYVEAWKAADVDRIAGLYAENAVVMYPNQPAVEGRAAIVAYFKGFFAEFPKNEFQLTSSEIEVVGPWAFDRGAYRWKGFPKAGGEPLEDTGKYLVVLQRQPDGEWKVARDSDNSDRPLAQSARGTK